MERERPERSQEMDRHGYLILKKSETAGEAVLKFDVDEKRLVSKLLCMRCFYVIPALVVINVSQGKVIDCMFILSFY